LTIQATCATFKKETKTTPHAHDTKTKRHD
jgi:hypothetical protein